MDLEYDVQNPNFDPKKRKRKRKRGERERECLDYKELKTERQQHNRWKH